MKKILIVAQREFQAMVATKAFLFTLVMMPILMFGGMVLMPTLSKVGGGKERKIIVADGTGEMLAQLQAAAEARNAALEATEGQAEQSESEENDFQPADRWKIVPAETEQLSDEQRLELSKQIRDGELYAFIEIPEDIAALTPPTGTQVDFVSQEGVLSPVRQWLASTLRQEVRTRRLQELEIDPQVVARADQPVIVNPVAPYTAGADGAAETDESLGGLIALFLPFGVMILMFMVILLAAQPMLESGMEEKTQRIAEVLLGSITPTQLMGGKLLGNVGGSLLIFFLYGIAGLFLVQQNGWDQQLPWSLMPWFVVFQILGVAFFSSIFLTVGATIRDLKEAQSMLLPVWLVLMAPMMVWFAAVRDPNGVVATSLSFFPPSSPMMMMLRLSSGQTIPMWQAPAAALLMLGSSTLVVWIAGRIYRNSLLAGDSSASFATLWKRFRAVS